MLPVSNRFLAAFRGSHQVVSRVRVSSQPKTYIGTNPAGRDLKVIGGSVTLDATADIRGTCDLLVAEKWPNSNTIADLVPYGTEVVVYRGIQYGSGGVERVPLGIYRLNAVEQDDAPKGALRLSGQDRMAGIIEARLLFPRVFSAATTVGSVMTTLVQEVYPGHVPQWDSADSTTGSNKTLGRVQVVEEDRFKFLDDMVRSLGKIWYFDYRGQLVIKNPPDPNTSVLEVNAGPNGVLVDADRGLTRDGVYNIVVATGEGMDTVVPLRAVAYDDDTSSVTYYQGPFGQVPFFFSSPFITSLGQAGAMAEAELVLKKGLPYSVDFTMVPMPALEPYDAVTVVYPIDLENQPHQRIEQHVLEQVKIGLAADEEMLCATKQSTNKGV